MVLINLGENGIPADADVIQALEKVRSRVNSAAKIIVMIPVSGKGRVEITRAFTRYKNAANDGNAYLIDLGSIQYATGDGQHPTAAGHQTLFQAVLPVIDAIVADVVDRDRDGLTDGWEQRYFLNPTNANPAAGCSNGVNTVLQAYISGLDPNDPNSKFLTSALRSPTSNVLGWNATSGRVYSIYWATNLLEGFHPLETNIPWTVGYFTDSVHSASEEGFYKIKVELAP